MTDDYLFVPTDIIIQVEEKNLHFYKQVLCQQSKYFEKMFTHDMKEKIDNIVKLDDIYNDVKELLTVIHPLRKNAISNTNVYILLRVAHMYSFQQVIDNCLSVLAINDNIDLDDLKKKLIFMHQFVQDYSEDQELCQKLVMIIDTCIAYFSQTTSYEFDPQKISDLPQDLLEIMVDKLYKNKRDSISTLRLKYWNLFREIKVKCDVTWGKSISTDDIKLICSKYGIDY